MSRVMSSKIIYRLHLEYLQKKRKKKKKKKKRCGKGKGGSGKGKLISRREHRDNDSPTVL
jgi:hypothetical protein